MELWPWSTDVKKYHKSWAHDHVTRNNRWLGSHSTRWSCCRARKKVLVLCLWTPCRLQFHVIQLNARNEIEGKRHWYNDEWLWDPYTLNNVVASLGRTKVWVCVCAQACVCICGINILAKWSKMEKGGGRWPAGLTIGIAIWIRRWREGKYCMICVMHYECWTRGLSSPSNTESKERALKCKDGKLFHENDSIHTNSRSINR